MATSIGWLAPEVRAGDPIASQAPSTDIQLDPDLSGLVDPIPYTFPQGGGDGSLGIDSSIQARPDFAVAERPSTKTALDELWSADERVWANPDGSFTVERGQNLNYLAADGAWKAIDLSLVQTKEGTYRPVSAPSDLTLPIDAADGTIAELKGTDGALSIKALGYDLGAKVDESLLYASLVDAPAVFVRPTDRGFEFGATFADPSLSPIAMFVLDTSGLKAEVAPDGHSILIRGEADDSGSDLAGSISMPFVIDEAGAETTLDQISVLLVEQTDGTYLLSYHIDPDWYGAKERVFPITLDPTACIRGGAGTSCDVNAGGAFDIWYGDGKPASWVIDSTTNYLHVGNYQATSDDWGFTRTALYFPGVALPDGAMVTSSTLTMREAQNYSGATVARVYARMINKPTGWTIDTSSASWNSLNGAIRSGYDSPQYQPCSTGATDCDINLDVTKMVRAWYSRRGPDWQPNTGIQLRYATENSGSNYWETSFYRYDASAGNRPQLTITYEVPAFELDFDVATLGDTYAPSTMLLGVDTVLPITINNNSSFPFTTANYRLGYRFFDMKGNVVSSSDDEPLTVTINSGTSNSSPIPLTVTPPSPVGAYTMRLDLVRVTGSDRLFASDWAAPSKYFSRNKRVLTSDSTRWTGSSVIERAEFGINVISGQGAAGDDRSVGTGDGGRLSVNLWTRNLSFDGDSGLGFTDRLPVGLTYGYNSVDAEPCVGYLGVLGACGWFTNYDERLTAGPDTGNFTYVDASGNAWRVDTDGNGQLVGAPTQLYRVRATLFDENRPTSGGSLTSVASLGISAYAGSANVVAVPSNATTTLSGTSAGGDISLNTYRMLRFAMRTSGATASALCAEIFNKTTATTKWFCYTTGTSWTTGEAQATFGGSINGAWATYASDLWAQVTGNGSFGDPEDDYYVKRIRVMAAPGSPASQTFIDAVRMTPKVTAYVADSVPSGMTGSPTTITTDKVTGTAALKATANADCETSCFTTTDISSLPFARWWWRKAGGETAAVRFRFKDVRTGQTGYITYYAGRVAPTDAPDCWHTSGLKCVIQVSPNVPGAWTRVTRNVLEDARQLLDFCYDSPTGTTTTTPPTQGPTPDRVQMLGYMLRPVDGNFLLVDQLTLSAAPDAADYDRFAVQDMGDSPTGSSDTRFTYDFKSEQADGLTHFFNRDGLLVRIGDANGQSTTVQWSYGGSNGQSNYDLIAIHAASDGTVSGSWTYNRQIDVSSAPAGAFNQITFTEALGTTGGGAVPGRRADFYVAAGAGASWGDKDLVKASQARHNGATCGTPVSGCLEFAYTNTTLHRLAFLKDPRYDGVGLDERTEVTWDGNGDPAAVLDRSHSSAILLKVLNWDRGTSALYDRPLYQDAAAAAANSAMHVQLSPDGSILTEYTRQTCGASCSSSPPVADDATLNARKAMSYGFDGLAHVNNVTTYRCPGVALGGCTGTTALLSVTRRATNASAKVDNFVDALAGAALAWTQSADQHFASLRDSGGTNSDLYRTEYTTDGLQKPIVTRMPTLDRQASYSDAVKSSQWLTQYWRLGELASPFANSAGGSSASSSTVTTNQPGALVRDSNAAVGFNGSSSRITSAATIPTSAYSIEAWFKPTSIGLTSRGIVGDYTSNSGVLVYITSTGIVALAHNSGRVFSSVKAVAGRWYHVVATWDGARAKLYIDGDLAGWTAVTGAPGSGATTLEIGAYSNAATGTFFPGSIDEVSIRSQAINQSKVRKHFYSGRGVAPLVSETQYDLRGRPLQTASQIALNGDIEEGLNGFDTNFGAVHETTIVHAGTGAIKLPASTSIGQDFVLAPGQRFQIQLWTRTDGTAGSLSVYEVYYWRASDQSWQTFSGSPLGVGNTTTWTVRAHQYTVPATDTPGLIRLAMWNGSALGPVYFDDILLTTGWSKQSYLGGALLEGLPDATESLSPTGSGTVSTKTLYTASAVHPGIFGTKVVRNHLDGTQGPNPDEDVTSTTTFDPWGRMLSTEDPDLVSSATVYAGNKTDIASVSDGFGNPTQYTYDEVGNVLTTTTPGGRVTSATFDARNQRLTVVAPDGTVAQTDFDDFGRATASWTNFINGNPTDGDGTDDLLTKYVYDAYGRVTQKDVDCGSVAACATNGLDARTLTSYDLLGNTVVSTVYAGSNGVDERVTTSHFETYGSSPKYSRLSASGVQLPISPSPTDTAFPLCPGSSTLRCNAASVWAVGTAWPSAIDMNGRAFGVTDGYGITTITDTDLAGQPVAMTANFVAGGPATSDQNVVTRTEYNLLRDVITSTDAMGRIERVTYDALGRTKTISHRTSADTEYLLESFVYLPSGRVLRSSDGAAWTKNEYDDAGRAVRTLGHFDTATSNARIRTAGFEDRTSTGWGNASGWFTTPGATLAAGDGSYHVTGARTGRGRLRITTSAGSFSGGYWDLAGPTFVAGHTYRLQADIKGPSGSTLRAFLGVDGNGADYKEDADADTAGTQSLPLNGSWQPLSIDWTPAATTTGSVHFAIRKDAAGSIDFYVDNVRFWDTHAGDVDWNIPSETVYDLDGRAIESILAPGDLRTERELVTTTAYDEADRVTAITVNSTSEYGNLIAAEGQTNGLVGYWPLDNLGSTANDEKGSNDLDASGPVARDVAGGPDDTRGAYRFNGSSTSLDTTTVPTAAIDNWTIEAWFRYDMVPTADQVVAYNGDGLTGWGIVVQADGSLTGLFSGVGYLDTNVVASAGPWHHVRLQRLAGVEKLYLDGADLPLTNTAFVPVTPSGTFSVGRYNYGPNPRYFDGDVDEVAVYTGSTSIADHFAAGRKSDVVTALTTRYSFDRHGRRTDSWTPKLVRMHFGYDRLGNLVETTDNWVDGAPTDGPTSDDDAQSTFGHNVLGELIGYCSAEEVQETGCDPNSIVDVQAWRYVWDDLGRQVKAIPPENQFITGLTTEETVYELGGRVSKTCRYAAGASCGSTDSRHTNFAYDDLSRIVTQESWTRTSGSDTLAFTKYLTWNKDGTPASVNEGTSASTKLTYEYDTAGRLYRFKRDTTILTEYAYNAGTGTIASRKDGTLTTAFSYDWARRVLTVNPDDAFVAGTVDRSYRVDGLLAMQAFPSSLTETVGYDAAKRPISINLGAAGSSSQTFDRAGNVTSDGRTFSGITGDAGANTQAFTYDGLSRLLASSGLSGSSGSYEYDLDGNRVKRGDGTTVTTYTYDRADQLYQQDIAGVSRTFAYDRYGNMTTSYNAASAATTYVRDAAGRLTGITPPSGGAVSFTLDALGRHASRTIAGGPSPTDSYAYIGSTETSWQTGQGTSTTIALLDVDGTRLAVKNGTSVSWLIFDLHGSVVGLCNGSGTITDAYRFNGWGEQVEVYPTSAGATNPWRYRGLLNIGVGWDAGVLLEMEARDYSPQLGTFTQQDSHQGLAANPASMNRFLYAQANPSTLIDPDGHMALRVDGGGSTTAPCSGSLCYTGSQPYGPTTTSTNTSTTTSTTNTGTTQGGSGSGTGATDVCDRGCERGPSAPAAPDAPPLRWGSIIGICANVGYGTPGLYESFSLCVATDEEGQYGLLLSTATGIGTGLDVSIGATGYVGDALTLQDATGDFWGVGASGGFKWNLGGDAARSTDHLGRPTTSATLGVQAGAQVSIPNVIVEYHGQQGSTVLLGSVDPGDALADYLTGFGPEAMYGDDSWGLNDPYAYP